MRPMVRCCVLLWILDRTVGDVSQAGPLLKLVHGVTRERIARTRMVRG